MKYTLIKNGVCVNVIEADAEFIKLIASDYDWILPAEGTQAEVGASWDGATYIRKDTSPMVADPVLDPFADINAKLDKVIADLFTISIQTKPKV
jgi:hypothetical protein